MSHYSNSRPRGGSSRSRPGGGKHYSSHGAQRRHSNHRQGGPKKQYIDPAKFVKAAKPALETAVEVKHSFADFAFHDHLHRAVEQRGFEQPSPIQDQAIPIGMSGGDVIGIANTGTGKTLAFGLPMLHRILSDENSQALILAPTRELAEQILDELRNLSQGSRVFWALLIGGAPMHKQLRDLQRRPNLVVGTPGRVKDHIERGSLRLQHFNLVALDEVDRMLDMGFVNDVRSILNETHPQSQSYFFSATMNNRVRTLVNEFSNDPATISVKTADTSENVEQDVMRYRNNEDKMEKLHEMLIASPENKVLIFDDTRRSVDRLHTELKTRGFKADTIHGGKSQGQRKRALAGFKNSHTNVLVATDVAARGIDVDDITHVINFSLPQSYDDYTHRIGRAGRAGRKGYAFTFLQA